MGQPGNMFRFRFVLVSCVAELRTRIERVDSTVGLGLRYILRPRPRSPPSHPTPSRSRAVRAPFRPAGPPDAIVCSSFVRVSFESNFTTLSIAEWSCM